MMIKTERFLLILIIVSMVLAIVAILYANEIDEAFDNKIRIEVSDDDATQI